VPRHRGRGGTPSHRPASRKIAAEPEEETLGDSAEAPARSTIYGHRQYLLYSCTAACPPRRFLNNRSHLGTVAVVPRPDPLQLAAQGVRRTTRGGTLQAASLPAPSCSLRAQGWRRTNASGGGVFRATQDHLRRDPPGGASPLGAGTCQRGAPADGVLGKRCLTVH
jgi:hypothetical protein